MVEIKQNPNNRILYQFIFFLILLIFCIPLVSNSVLASSILGTVYDYSLEPVKNIVVEINSTPKQTMVAKGGAYSFEVNPGSYEISASYIIRNQTKIRLQDLAEEKIIVTGEGTFNIDLIIFPNVEVESEFNETIAFEEITAQRINYLPLFIAAVIFLIIIFAVFKIVSNQTSKYVNEVLKEIESEKKTRKVTRKVKNEKLKEKKEEKKEEREETNLEQKEGKNKKLGLDQYENKIMEILERCEGRTTQKDIRKEIPLSEAKISLVLSDLEAKKLIKKIKKGRGNIIILEK
ncbi:MAG TPA: hypothetical protein VI894_01435 [Candidatus Nanoarchaeia archaeon]|nr:hypothetical protein [Candidatus Nanoarchaeia archaeon]